MTEQNETTNINHTENADMPTDTTTNPEAATLTEKGLWARFVAARIQTTYAMGPTVDSYCPAELIADPGEYGHIGDLTADFANWISDVEDPESELNCFIEDLSNYVEGLRTVRDDFVRTMARLVVNPDAESEDEVRYRVPVIEQKEAA